MERRTFVRRWALWHAVHNDLTGTWAAKVWAERVLNSPEGRALTLDLVRRWATEDDGS